MGVRPMAALYQQPHHSSKHFDCLMAPNKRFLSILTPNSIDLARNHLIPLYKRPSILFTHGRGCTLVDSDQQRYLDFTAGIAVNVLGHSHPSVTESIHRQSSRVIHTSNLFHSEPAILLSRDLIESFRGFLLIFYVCVDVGAV